MNPKFTVITSVYNCEKYLPNAINSVLGQSFKDFEYIIVNDGSLDGTLDVIKKYSSIDKRIKVIDQSNQYVYASHNNALNIATGEYVTFLNADDLLGDNILEIVDRKTREYNKPDVVWTKLIMHRCDDNQQIIEYNADDYDGRFSEELYFGDVDELRLFWHKLYYMVLSSHPHNYYKRSVIGDHRFRNKTMGDDTYFNSELASDLSTALVLPNVSVNFMAYPEDAYNLSLNKFYDYLGDMYDDFLRIEVNNHKSWGIFTDDIKEYYYKRRLGQYTIEIRSLRNNNCHLTSSEKAKYIMEKILRKTIIDITTELGVYDELESRTIHGVQEVFENESLDPDDDYYFIYALAKTIQQAKDEKADFSDIKDYIEDKRNIYRFGKGVCR